MTPWLPDPPTSSIADAFDDFWVAVKQDRTQFPSYFSIQRLVAGRLTGPEILQLNDLIRQLGQKGWHEYVRWFDHQGGTSAPPPEESPATVTAPVTRFSRRTKGSVSKPADDGEGGGGAPDATAPGE